MKVSTRRPVTQPQLDLLTTLFLDHDVHHAVREEFERQLPTMTTAGASAWISVISETQPVRDRGDIATGQLRYPLY